jgi:hypothetical protein
LQYEFGSPNFSIDFFSLKILFWSISDCIKDGYMYTSCDRVSTSVYISHSRLQVFYYSNKAIEFYQVNFVTFFLPLSSLKKKRI